MPDQAVLNQAAAVLTAISADQRADLALKAHFDGRRTGSWRERREIVSAVFAYFRWLNWVDRDASPQAQLAQALDFRRRFAADEASIKAEALAARAVPEWVRSEMELPPDYLRQLQREPALWIRARPGTRAVLAEALGDCEPSPRAPDALRYRGERDLFQVPEFKAGAFEIQDLASQLVGLSCAPQPGEKWWDACAGEGGKTLLLADLMGNKGLVWATDRNVRRLENLKRRAGRAKLFNYQVQVWEGGPIPGKARFDGVLVDAPCSGVGTWQRNPHARWTTTPADVSELAAIQATLLGNVCGSVKKGGRLVYSVCTLTRSETTAVAEAFSSRHREFEPVSQGFIWPQDIDANGMFVAVWQRTAGPQRGAEPAG